MKKLLVICGPTATGKTSFGIFLAKKINGEIVSADSRQVYKGMDIGTGKDLPVNSKFKNQNLKLNFRSKNLTIGFYEIEGIKLWLYDMTEPDYKFSVADYVKCANLVIKNIWQRKKLPIIVGGTGFYIKGLIDGIKTLGVPPNWNLRKKLNSLDIEELRKILEKENPERWLKMNDSDKQNPRRLIRAIEIAKANQSSFSGSDTTIQKADVFWVGLTAPYDSLYKKIDKRVEERVKMGIEEEIKNLLNKGYTFDNSVLGTTIGYREWKEYLKNKTENMEEKKRIIQKWKFDEHAYARRQTTWFRREPRIHWADITKKDWQREIEQLIKAWYNSSLDA